MLLPANSVLFWLFVLLKEEAQSQPASRRWGSLLNEVFFMLEGCWWTGSWNRIEEETLMLWEVMGLLGNNLQENQDVTWKPPEHVSPGLYACPDRGDLTGLFARTALHSSLLKTSDNFKNFNWLGACRGGAVHAGPTSGFCGDQMSCRLLLVFSGPQTVPQWSLNIMSKTCSLNVAIKFKSWITINFSSSIKPRFMKCINNSRPVFSCQSLRFLQIYRTWRKFFWVMLSLLKMLIWSIMAAREDIYTLEYSFLT